jgi:hypothetical protein
MSKIYSIIDLKDIGTGNSKSIPRKIGFTVRPLNVVNGSGPKTYTRKMVKSLVSVADAKQKSAVRVDKSGTETGAARMMKRRGQSSRLLRRLDGSVATAAKPWWS